MTTYHRVAITGHEVFYREAGPKDAPTIVLLHGFPSSSHMFRELIPMLANCFHVIAPDYIGFGYSAQPDAKNFQYTFENLSAHVETLLFDALKLKHFTIYVQDYGAPIGFRIAARRPDAIDAIVVQNGNAYLEGISAAFDPLKPFWANRSGETEKPVRNLLTIESTRFQYVHGAMEPEKVNPDSYTFDQLFLDRPGNNEIQLDLFYNYPSNVELYPAWHRYFREKQPPALILWGQNDPFFTVEGANAFLRDLPKAELHFLNAGHFALEDHAEFVAERMQQFLGRLGTKAVGR